MADANNKTGFGSSQGANPSEAAKKSTGQFGAEHGADPSVAGKQGAEAQPTEAKAEGGRHSHQNDSNT